MNILLKVYKSFGLCVNKILDVERERNR